MQFLKTALLLAIISFLLHLGWESSHLPLYGGYESLSPILPITIWAAIGDVLYTIGAVLLVALLKGRLNWIREATYKDIASLAVLGFFIAVFVEYKGLFLNRWHYLEAMPVISGLGVGLSPILQMSLLLPVSVFLTKYLLKKNLKLHGLLAVVYRHCGPCSSATMTRHSGGDAAYPATG